jgi:PKD repeat protein
LQPNTAYDIRLTLSTGHVLTVAATQSCSDPNASCTRTWSETFSGTEIDINTLMPATGFRRLWLRGSQGHSGTPGNWKIYTAPAGSNTIDQAGFGTNADGDTDACVNLEGVSYVVIRGLNIKNCTRHAIFLDTGSRQIVIEENDISGWGGWGTDVQQGVKLTNHPNQDGAITCTNPTGRAVNQIIVQNNSIHNPRHNATHWHQAQIRQPPPDGTLKPNQLMDQRDDGHTTGPLAVRFGNCGNNHVIRYNNVYGTEDQKYFNDGLGGCCNFNNEGFPWADSDIYSNRISHVYDDAIEAEGGNRNVRIWENYIDRAYIAIGTASTAVGPLYVWRNVSRAMDRMHNPSVDNPDNDTRGEFVKSGGGAEASDPNGGRAYYFHNTALQPPNANAGGSPLGVSMAINGGSNRKLYNFHSKNNIWHTWRDASETFNSNLLNTAERNTIVADHDLYNGVLTDVPGAEKPGIPGKPIYASSGNNYPNLTAEPGNFSLAANSPGTRAGDAFPLPNFNDLEPIPHVGAQRAGQDAMKFGREAALPAATADLTAAPTAGPAPLPVQFNSSHSFGSPVTYSLSFDDGTPNSTLPNPSHTYNAGRFTAMLTVTETSTGRTATDSVTIDVGAPQGGGGSTSSAFGLFVSAGPGLVINRAAGESINFSVAAADARVLTRVRFFIDGVERLADTSAPFQFNWLPSAGEATGSRALLVEATDAAGNLAFETRTLTLLSDTCNIFVAPLSVIHGEPLDAQGLCSASQQIDHMEFFVDNVLQSPSRDPTPAYTWRMDTSSFAAGTRVIRVRGVRGGASIGEHSVSVQIVAAPLTLSFSPGSVVSRTEGMTVTASATDGRALRQVDFFINGEFRAGENMAPYALSWPVSGSSPRPDRFGRQQLVVQATDLDGNVLAVKRDLYVLTQTCNVLVATSKYQVGSHDTVLAGPHTIVQGEWLTMQGLCSASQSVQQIEFYVDGVRHVIDVSAPYGWILSTGDLAVGSHTVSIIARLAGGAVSSHAIPIEIVAPR